MSLTKNPKPKNFFHCRREDLLYLCRVWTALYSAIISRDSRGKTRANCWIF